VVGVIGLALLGINWYSKTDDFQHRVGGQVVKVLEDSIGGRVEMGHLRFDLWHLAIEVDGLTIHGLEAPGEAPYLAADKIFVRIQIHTFLKRATGASWAEDPGSHIGLNWLRVEHPQVHLIIDKDGKTNQPTPRKPSTSTTPVMDTLLDLEAKKVEVVNGVALINDKAVPFQMAAHEFEANVHYIGKTDHYGATLDMNDLRTQIDKEVEAQSKLRLEVEVGRDIAELKALDLHTGANSRLTASGKLEHFAKPVWQVSATGLMELKQVSVLSGADGFTGGQLDINVQGHSCAEAPVEAQKKPHFWQREQAAKEHAAGAKKTIPPDPECSGGYLLVGGIKARNAGFRDEYVRVAGVNASAELHVTPVELLFSALTSELPEGGKIAGQLRIENWLGEVPVDAPARSATTVGAATATNTVAKNIGAKAPITSLKAPSTLPAHAYMEVVLSGLTLRTVMDITGPEHYGDLGFDTAVSGPAKVEWGGPATDIESSVKVDGDLKFTPTGSRRKGVLQNIPVTGSVLAHYDGTKEVVNIQRMDVHTPQSNMNIDGVLGVNKGDPLTNLRAGLELHDLGEFDSLLQTLGFESNGKKGSDAIPVVLHGAANLHVVASGAVKNLRVKGHVDAEQVEAKFGTVADFLVDSAAGDVDYSPSNVAIASSTIKRGSAVLNVSGTFIPRTVQLKHGVDYVWDENVNVDAQVTLADAQVQDVMQMAGQQNKLPVSGTINVDGHVQGTIQQMNGSGRIALANGMVYGEPYQSVNVNWTVAGQDIEVSSTTATLHGMNIAGRGGYDVGSKHLHGHVQGSGLVLSKFVTVQKQGLNADATLSLNADADGTIDEPNLKADVKVGGIRYDGQAMGDASIQAHSQGSLLYYTATSTLVGASISAEGQTQLNGDYQTQAKLTLSGADIGKPLEMFNIDKVKASSSIAGTINVQGPLKQPTALSGQAELTSVDVKLQGIELKSVEPLRVSLKNGIATLEQLHITGDDTDLKASGTAQLFGSTNPNGGTMNLHADGGISMALAHTFDKDLTSSGRVSFTVAAAGQLKKPTMTGQVKFENVNLAMDGVPNGLNNMNGTLVFTQDRLQVQQLTATTGGGQLKIGGFLTLQNGGLYANLTATGETVRVRLYGLSATANANFSLTGGPQSLLLNGNVLITRFGVGANVDFAAFAGAGGVSAPPDPDSAANKIHLDVHVVSSPQLDFQNSYAKLAGTVDLNVRGTAAVPSVLGRIQITDGSATFAGTKYQVQRGDIYFTNPVRIDPIIDLDVTARVENYDVTVGLHGTTTAIKPTYRSEPPLSEADIFNLLALGRTQEEAQLYQQQQIQAGTDPTTSALLGGALNATVSSRVSKLFGQGSVKIDPAFVGTLGNSSARITVQEPLGRQLTLTFATNINQSAQQLIQLQYQLNPTQSIVMTRDEGGVFSIVYKIRKRYR